MSPRVVSHKQQVNAKTGCGPNRPGTGAGKENNVTGPQSHELRPDIPNESAQTRERPREPQPGAFSFLRAFHQPTATGTRCATFARNAKFASSG